MTTSAKLVTQQGEDPPTKSARAVGEDVYANAPNQSRLLTISQAAAYLNTTKWAIKSMIWSRELPIVPLGKRYMLDISDLDAVVARRKRLV